MLGFGPMMIGLGSLASAASQDCTLRTLDRRAVVIHSGTEYSAREGRRDRGSAPRGVRKASDTGLTGSINAIAVPLIAKRNPPWIAAAKTSLALEPVMTS